jgi:zinc transport system ATP-binding protein
MDRNDRSSETDGQGRCARPARLNRLCGVFHHLLRTGRGAQSSQDTLAAHVFPVDSVLHVNNLSVRFGDTTILRNVTFSVERGAWLAIVGPNGAGKTVLLKALIGALPLAGTCQWAPDARIGYVPQKLDIARDVPITGIDFIKARIALAGTSTEGISEVLSSVGLTASAGKLPIGALSGGEFQRLLMAFALVSAPNVLLLDEPTVGIDEPGQERLNKLVHRLQRDQGLTVLLVSHDLSIACRYATAVLCLGRDQVFFGPARDILTPDLLHEVYGTPVGFHNHDR